MQAALQLVKELGQSEICFCNADSEAHALFRSHSFVLADTERLHKKMSQMSNRIRQLEEALASSHSINSPNEHPLLNNELLSVKTLQDLHINPDIPAKESKSTSQAPAEFVDAFGTLAIAEDGAARFYGRSGGSEVCNSVPPFHDVKLNMSTPESINCMFLFL